MNYQDNDDVPTKEVQMRQRIKYLEKQLDANVRTLERICTRLNIKYKRLNK